MLVLAICLLPLAGCRTWQPAGMETEALFAMEAPERVRVTREDGEQLILERPELRAGAIVATAAPGAVLIDEVELLEIRKVDVMRSIAFGLPGALILVLVGLESCRC